MVVSFHPPPNLKGSRADCLLEPAATWEIVPSNRRVDRSDLWCRSFGSEARNAPGVVMQA